MIIYNWTSGTKYGGKTTTGKSYMLGNKRYVEVICSCGTIRWPRLDTIQNKEEDSFCRCKMAKHEPVKVGQVFGRLTVIGVPYKWGKNYDKKVRVMCVCGKVKEVHIASLNNGGTVSCGCFHKELFSNITSTHKLSTHLIYRLWARLKTRCLNKNSVEYRKYGAKGVMICDEWRDDFMSFYNWAKDKWRKGLELDKDILYNKKHGTRTGKLYSPEYCCFVTGKANCRQKTTNRIIEYNGFKKTLIEWSEILGISAKVIGGRINKHKWSVERAMSTPTRIRRKDNTKK